MEKDAALTQLQNKCDNTVEQLKVIHMLAQHTQQIHAFLHAFHGSIPECLFCRSLPLG